MHFDNPVYNGDVPSFNVEHYNLSYSDGIIMQVGKKQEVTTVKCWFHTTTEVTKQTYTYSTSTCIMHT